MTSEYELPPLPKGDIAADTCPVMWVHTDAQLQAYARAAVEADRIKRDDYINDDRDQLRAEIVALKGTIADLEAGRPRRGELVGHVVQPSPAHFPGVYWLSEVHDGMELYTAPQPAEPSRGEPVAWRWRIPIVANNGDVLGYSDWVLGNKPNFLSWWPHEELMPPQSAAPVVKESLTVAEPVKVPSDDLVARLRALEVRREDRRKLGCQR